MVARAPLSMRPAGLHDGFGWCPVHAEAWHPGVRRTCPKCASLPSMPTKAGAPASKPKRPRSGHVTEALLCAVLDRCGLIDAFNAGPTTPAEVVYVREFAWGIYLPEPRLFRFDAAVPARRLAFEADGGAHYTTKRQGRHDTERRGLAAAHGWRVVAMRPDQIQDRTADELVRAALEVTTS